MIHTPLHVTRFATALSCAALVLAAAGSSAAALAARADLVAVICLTGAVSLVAAIAGIVPAARLSRRRDDGIGLGFILGTLVRVLLCGLGAFVIARVGGWPANAVFACAGGWYVALLAVEVILLVRHLGRAPLVERGGRA